MLAQETCMAHVRTHQRHRTPASSGQQQLPPLPAARAVLLFSQYLSRAVSGQVAPSTAVSIPMQPRCQSAQDSSEDTYTHMQKWEQKQRRPLIALWQADEACKKGTCHPSGAHFIVIAPNCDPAIAAAAATACTHAQECAHSTAEAEAAVAWGSDPNQNMCVRMAHCAAATVARLRMYTLEYQRLTATGATRPVRLCMSHACMHACMHA
jgi:hypothetical protein